VTPNPFIAVILIPPWREKDLLLLESPGELNLAGGENMAEQPRKMTDSEIAAGLKSLPGWAVVAGKLHREYQFENFVQAFGFMASAALVAESMNHHPEWFNVYQKVVVDLATHSIGGISNFDLELAKKMEALA